MAWSVGIKGEISVDGDEGTIYLPEEVFEYMVDHKFSIICVKRTEKELTSVSCRSDHYEVHTTKYR